MTVLKQPPCQSGTEQKLQPWWHSTACTLSENFELNGMTFQENSEFVWYDNGAPSIGTLAKPIEAKIFGKAVRTAPGDELHLSPEGNLLMLFRSGNLLIDNIDDPDPSPEVRFNGYSFEK